MSAWLLMGLPGAVYLMGINQIWLPLGLTIGAYLNWQFIATRLRVYTEIVNDAITIPEYFVNRFHDQSKVIRVVAASIILIFFTVYTASGLVAGAFLMEQTFGFNYQVALWGGAAIIMTYTAFGGFLAVSWTDFLQGMLMLVALCIVPYVTMQHLGGFRETIAIIANHDINFVDAYAGITLIGTISLLAWGLGYFGQPHIIVRFMSVKTHHEIPKAKMICMSWMVFSLLGAMFTGYAGIAYFIKEPLVNPELVFIALSKTLFTPWISGLIMAAILSSTMCAIDSQMLVSSSALTEDLYKGLIRKNASQKELVWVGRLAVLLIALVAIFLASNPKSRILELVAFAWAGLGAAFGPSIILSLYWKRMTRNGAVAGMLVGALTAIIWHQLKGGIFEFYELLPGFIFSAVVVVLVSLLDKKQSAEVNDEFNKMQQAIQ